MSLLHKLVRKVSKVLKNQRALASNQKQLAGCYNTDHHEHPIQLESVNESDSEPQLEVETGFDALSPQLRTDPQSQDEGVAVVGVGVGGGSGDTSAGVSTTRDDAEGEGDEDDDYEDEEEDHEDDAADGVEQVIASEGSDFE